MKLLVLGGTRFIGPALVRRLIDSGHEVAVFHRGQTRAESPSTVKMYVGDRRRLEKSRGVFLAFHPEVVVDMIAFTERDARALVETFRGLARRTVVISSADVYRAYGRFLGIEGGPVEPTPLSEEAPLRSALFPYRHQAKGADDLFHDYDKILVERVVMEDVRLPGTILRLPMVHGPGDPYRRLGSCLGRMDDGRPAILLDATMARWKCPRGHVENVAAAIALAATDERSAGRVYNVAEPIAYTEAGWVRRVGEAAGWTGNVVEVGGGKIPVPFNVAQSLDTNSDRIRHELDYAEPVAPADGLRATVDWERSQPRTGVPGIGLLDYAAEDELLADSVPQGS
jgi:nucleoside-diphosphate-sugar epimerase